MQHQNETHSATLYCVASLIKSLGGKSDLELVVMSLTLSTVLLKCLMRIHCAVKSAAD